MSKSNNAKKSNAGRPSKAALALRAAQQEAQAQVDRHMKLQLAIRDGDEKALKEFGIPLCDITTKMKIKASETIHAFATQSVQELKTVQQPDVQKYVSEKRATFQTWVSEKYKNSPTAKIVYGVPVDDNGNPINQNNEGN
ncbi:hypothetical protein [Buttiauxella noackiae]|uniref:hypothetical protein n=1 Tax=Buttiauxella noackiae TaxID=82992 RepID=UPI000555C876|nr:hypothetical protein [Buttiauxella noackiae]